MPDRQQPNLLITGTPGVGKTSTASLIAVSVQPVAVYVDVDQG